MVIDRERSGADAIKELFDVDLSQHKKFKDDITTLEGKGKAIGVLKLEKLAPLPDVRYGRRVYRDEHMAWLNNAILLQGFFSKPSVIKSILDKPEARIDQVQFLKEALGSRSEVGGIVFNPTALEQFLSELSTGINFEKEMLTNPFISLPQLDEMSVIYALNHEGACAKDIMMMMDAYFSNDLSKAYEIAQKLDDVRGVAAQYKTLIEKEYKDAQEFDDLLDFFQK